MYLQVNLNLEKMNQALEAFTCVFVPLFNWNILQKTMKAPCSPKLKLIQYNNKHFEGGNMKQKICHSFFKRNELPCVL